MEGLSFNLLDQLVFYGAYHNNKWNQLIHFFTVPVIIFSGCVWLAQLGPLLQLPPDVVAAAPAFLAPGLQVNVPCAVVAVGTLFYVSLDPFAGLTWGACIGVPAWLAASAFARLVPHAVSWALALHVFGWYMQLHPGHAILEGRKAALLDSLVQAVVLAPLFVWFELLFLVGYRPRLRAQLQQRVEAAITEWKQQKQQ